MNIPAPVMANGIGALTAYKIDQPAYLTHNWKLLQASSYNAYSIKNRMVKVFGGIASITNGDAVIRCPVNLPDGFYLISEENEFVTESPRRSGYNWDRFPDVDAAMPDFKALDYTPPITRDKIGEIVEYMDFIRKHASYERVLVEGDLLIAQGLDESWLRLPHVVPIRGDGIVFDASIFKIIFKEMLRYDFVHIGFDNTLIDNNVLVIGKDWGHCALCSGRR